MKTVMKTVQMTLDDSLVEAVDRAAKDLGTTRSAYARDALRVSLNHLRERELEERHRAGYERHPSSPATGKPGRRLGRRMQRGEVRWYRISSPDKKHPVPLLTRDSVLEYLGEVTIAPITMAVQEIPSGEDLQSATLTA